jgi:sec-independent protein translocase protein TatC
VPIILLYEVSIWMAQITERKRAEAEAEVDREVNDE